MGGLCAWPVFRQNMAPPERANEDRGAIVTALLLVCGRLRETKPWRRTGGNPELLKFLDQTSVQCGKARWGAMAWAKPGSANKNLLESTRFHSRPALLHPVLSHPITSQPISSGPSHPATSAPYHPSPSPTPFRPVPPLPTPLRLVPTHPSPVPSPHISS